MLLGSVSLPWSGFIQLQNGFAKADLLMLVAFSVFYSVGTNEV